MEIYTFDETTYPGIPKEVGPETIQTNRFCDPELAAKTVDLLHVRACVLTVQAGERTRVFRAPPAALGRADAEQARREWNMLPKPDARFTI